MQSMFSWCNQQVLCCRAVQGQVGATYPARQSLLLEALLMRWGFPGCPGSQADSQGDAKPELGLMAAGPPIFPSSFLVWKWDMLMCFCFSKPVPEHLQ